MRRGKERERNRELEREREVQVGIRNSQTEFCIRRKLSNLSSQ